MIFNNYVYKEVSVRNSSDVRELAMKYGLDNLRWRCNDSSGDRLPKHRFLNYGKFVKITNTSVEVEGKHTFDDRYVNAHGHLKFNILTILIPDEEAYATSFTRLINVANEARGRGIISDLFITDEYIDFKCGGKLHRYFDQVDNTTAINNISEFYYDVFQILTNDDIKKVNMCAEVTFPNGNTGLVIGKKSDNSLSFSNDICVSDLGFHLLKGSTVKQSSNFEMEVAECHSL